MRKVLKSASPIVIFFSLLFALFLTFSTCGKNARPNLIFVFADEWRAQATGYAGDPNVRTPNLDVLAKEGILFTNAVSGTPVCSPYRASLLTGQFPLTHGVFYNDKPLKSRAKTFAEVYKAAGYNTAYIGKWHLNGHEKGQSGHESRRSPVPAARRFGFDFWKVCECTHDYNNSIYFDEIDSLHVWEGYDAIDQTRLACNYIESQPEDKPFLLFLSWGPPHDPYHTAPAEYENLYRDYKKLSVRPNVPDSLRDIARQKLAGYYAHITVLDDCMGALLQSLKKSGLESETILVFTSDHGEMLYSHGMTKKQKPWDESILVPFILRYPDKFGREGSVIRTPVNTPDIMPTLLGLSGLEVPASVEGDDLSGLLGGDRDEFERAVLISCPVPFHQWNYRIGGKEYRGIRTSRYTYVRDLKGPWLLFDNLADPYQLENLVNRPENDELRSQLDDKLRKELIKRNDQFLAGPFYMKKWDYEWDKNDSPEEDSWPVAGKGLF